METRMLNQHLYEEHNITRLGLISIMTSIPEDLSKGWTENLSLGDVQGTITCHTAKPELGVPHGFDNDVVSALHTLYIMQGMPTNGKVVTTGAELLRLIGVAAVGQSYQRLLTSIRRLSSTHYELNAHWFSAKQKAFGEASFTQVSDYNFVKDPHPFLEDDYQTRIEVTLNERIRQNLDYEHLIRLDPNILAPLNSPTTRAFYRMLETMRRPPGNLLHCESTLRVELTTLRSRARILTRRGYNSDIKRIFGPALKSLNDLKYLSKIEETTQRGVVWYEFTFSDAVSVMDRVALTALMQIGVWEKQAREFAAAIPRDVILEVIRDKQERHAQGTVRDVAAIVRKTLEEDQGRSVVAARTASRQTGAPRKGATKTIDAAPTSRALGDGTQPRQDTTAPNGEAQALSILRGLEEQLQWSNEETELVKAGILAGKINLASITKLIIRKDTKASELLS